MSSALNIVSSIGELATKELLSKSHANVDIDFETFFDDSETYSLTFLDRDTEDVVTKDVEGDFLEGKKQFLARVIKEPEIIKRDKDSILNAQRSLEKIEKRLKTEKDQGRTYRNFSRFDVRGSEEIFQENGHT